jgi:hypothetical protein
MSMSSWADGRLSKRKRIAYMALSITGGLVLGFIVVEGGLSAILFLRDVLHRLEADRRAPVTHQYDSELGWVNKPNTYSPDAYGPGVYVRINSQGVRASHELAASRPAERVRVICSGDSFTYGVGVDNDHTWCHLLELKNPHLETVNLGQSGYGVDQAYLRYQRDAAHIQHDIHLFAFIIDDFRRMRTTGDGIYHKPTLALQDGALTVRDVPVQRPLIPTLWLAGLRAAVPDLRGFEFVKRIYARFAPEPALDSSALDSTTAQIVAKIADSLGAMAQSSHATLVWIVLPARPDYLSAFTDRSRRWLRAAAGRRFLYLDLVQELKQLPPDSIDPMFLPPSAEHRAASPDAGGHYTERGNAWVADRIYQFLNTVPALSRRLSAPQLLSAHPNN